MKNAIKKFLIIALMVVVTLSISGITMSSAEVREKALNTAIAQAGVSADEIYDVEVEIEKKNGVVIIEVEFEADGMDYEYRIDKETGKIISSSVKRDDYTPGNNTEAESGKEIITKVDALDIALADAGLKGKDVKDLDIDLEEENGVLYYEIDFERKTTNDKNEYEYKIDAYTGTILKKEINDKPAAPSATPAVPSVPTEAPTAKPTEKPVEPQIITRDEALNIALKDAGLDNSEIKKLDIDLDYDDGVLSYEIEFERKISGSEIEYEYDIDAYTGEILKKEVDDRTPAVKPDVTPDVEPEVPQIITRDEALNIALKDAGIDVSDISDLDIDLDKDDGVLSYEIEFEKRTNGSEIEYEYDIDAYTGEILKKDVDDKTPSAPVVTPTPPAAPQTLTRDEALNIALKDAGLKVEDVSDLEIDFDEDDGILSYEIEFEDRRNDSEIEYEYDIDAYTGEILKKEVDDKTPSAPVVTPTPSAAPQTLTRDEAMAIALKDSGVNKADVRELEIELDRDDGFLLYEVEFKTYKNGVETEYEYDIDAKTGEILKKDIEIDD